jgi:glycosyltransferase involved in cell wall biosynthesis
MRIGIDARELCGHPTGVGRHLAGLLGAWERDGVTARHNLVLYSHEALPPPIAHADVRVVPGAGRTLWEQTALSLAANRDRLDVFFAPGYTAPLRLSIPSVVLVHDISFAAHPEWYRWKEGTRRRLLTRWASKRARVVLTVSEAARREIIRFFGLAPARVRRIYPGVVSLKPHGGGSLERESLAADRGPLVLFVGSIFNRRHLPDLIRAFKPIAGAHPDARLAIVGDNRTYPYEDLDAIARSQELEHHVILHPYADDRRLAELYGRARAFALLSEYEGFGHPPLEALGSRVPSVLFDTEVAREVCGEAALYVPPGDVGAVTSALHSLLFDEAVRTRILQAAPAVLARYSWARAAAETIDAIESAAR